VTEVNCPRVIGPVERVGFVLTADAKEALTVRSTKPVRTSQIPAGETHPFAGRGCEAV